MTVAALYTRLYGTSNRLLQLYGADAVLGSVTEGDYDPATSSDVPVVTNTTVRAGVFDYDDKEIDGTFILRTDKLALIAPGAGVKPVPGDRFTWLGDVHTIVSVKTVTPAGLDVLYKAQIRG